MTFEEFIESMQSLRWSEDEREFAEMVWQVAQEAERERVTAIMMKYIHDDSYAYWNEAVRAYWNEAVKAAVRGINEPT